MKARAIVKLIHHDFVGQALWEVVIVDDLGVFKILRIRDDWVFLSIAFAFVWLLMLLVICPLQLVGMMKFINFFILEDLGVDVPSHVGIVSCLMIVAKCCSPIVVSKSAIKVELEIQDVLESLVCLTLFVNLTKYGLAKVVCIVREHLSIKREWESIVPQLYKFFISLWKWPNKLVVEVDDIIHHVVTDDRTVLFCLEDFDHDFDYLWEAKFT
jgi:hypothetical protein